MNVPASLTIGDTWSWSEELSDYPATTYSLSFALWKYGRPAITITTTGSGNTYTVSVSSATTTAYSPGDYNWTAYVSTTVPSTRTTIGGGVVTIRPNIAAANSVSDYRTVNEVLLSNLDAAILKLANREVDSVTVNGRTVNYKDLGDLRRERAAVHAEVVNERRIASGGSTSRISRIQFGRA